ncbi:MAG: hypothetical protein ACD_28C00180G0002 [uncultured bacterium]|nr:MAG: hypothetical protein ACD_28C00180G0002 [uncultured bacterium]
MVRQELFMRSSITIFSGNYFFENTFQVSDLSWDKIFQVENLNSVRY